MGSGDIAPRILNLGARWRWLVSFTPQPLYPREKNAGTYWIEDWVGSGAGLDAVAKGKIPNPSRESNLHHSDSPARSLVATPTELSRICQEFGV